MTAPRVPGSALKPPVTGPASSLRLLGLRVRKAREAAQLTQAELASRAGLSRTTISNVETGRQGIGALSFALLARALGTGMDRLIRAGDLPPEAGEHR